MIESHLISRHDIWYSMLEVRILYVMIVVNV